MMRHLDKVPFGYLANDCRTILAEVVFVDDKSGGCAGEN